MEKGLILLGEAEKQAYFVVKKNKNYKIKTFLSHHQKMENRVQQVQRLCRDGSIEHVSINKASHVSNSEYPDPT